MKGIVSSLLVFCSSVAAFAGDTNSAVFPKGTIQGGVSTGAQVGYGYCPCFRWTVNVTLANGSEAAEAQHAVYEVAAGTVEMEGDVLLTQGQNALSGERLNIDLNAGTARLEGQVQTIFVPGSRP